MMLPNWFSWISFALGVAFVMFVWPFISSQFSRLQSG